MPEPARARRSLRVAVELALSGCALAAVGASGPWATAEVRTGLPGFGNAVVGGGSVSGNDLAPVGAVALLVLVVLVGVAFSRGRARWIAGAGLAVVGWALIAQTLSQLTRLGGPRGGEILVRRLGLPVAPGGVEVTPGRLWPGLVVVGGLLILAAGAETLRAGRSWPALGSGFKPRRRRERVGTAVAGSEAVPSTAPHAGAEMPEPPWEGD